MMNNRPVRNNDIAFQNARLLYPDFLGEGRYNTYGRPLFNVVLTPDDAQMAADSGLKVKTTKPTQAYPDEEFYTEVLIMYHFLNKQTGIEEPARFQPVITLNDIARNRTIVVTEDTLELLKNNRLSNICITVSQSTPRLNAQGRLTSRLYLRTMTADIVPFFKQGE